MHYFSGFYKKMCEKAVKIQELWREKIEDWDNYCAKSDHEDGFSSTVHLKGMTEEEIEDLVKNNVWLPLDYQIRERLFRTHGLASIRELVEKSYSDYLHEHLENEEKLNEIREPFKQDEIMNVLALMFVMEKYYEKRWDFDEDNWV